MISNPQALSAPDVYAAVYDFVAAWALPAINPDYIIRGWQNRSHRPPDTNEYAVISVLSEVRRGTNVTTLRTDPQNTDDGALVKGKLTECMVQIDFCSDNETARQRAAALETAMRDEFACDFFASYGINALYADDPRELSFVDGSEQFVKRYMITLHMSYWSELSASSDWFNQVQITRVEDVDAHHKP